MTIKRSKKPRKHDAKTEPVDALPVAPAELPNDPADIVGSPINDREPMEARTISVTSPPPSENLKEREKRFQIKVDRLFAEMKGRPDERYNVLRNALPELRKLA